MRDGHRQRLVEVIWPWPAFGDTISRYYQLSVEAIEKLLDLAGHVAVAGVVIDPGEASQTRPFIKP
jgi:hypothetical protein